MVTIANIKKAREVIKEWKMEGLTVGFVPTMGYLHKGHESLMERAKQECDKVVVSIFVNPTQFGPNEDFEKYPRKMEKDSELCEGVGVDMIFAPMVEGMYSNQTSSFVDVIKLTDGLCGKSREGHFRGVCTVVSKLFNIIPADKAYFGEKDAQQLAVIKKMVEDLNFDIEIVACPIVRDMDGIAMSSRNAYLTQEEREIAQAVPRSLFYAKTLLQQGEIWAIKLQTAIETVLIARQGIKVDYIEVVDAKNLQPIDKVTGSTLVAIAVFVGKTRLIDNFTWDG